MKNTVLAIWNDADDAAYLNHRYACARTHAYGLNRTVRHLRHGTSKNTAFGGSRAHTHLTKVARTGTAALSAGGIHA